MESVNGELRFHNSLDKPIPALYVQFIPEEAGKHLTLNKVQIYGCRLGESSICLHILQFLTYGRAREQMENSRSLRLLGIVTDCSS